MAGNSEKTDRKIIGLASRHRNANNTLALLFLLVVMVSVALFLPVKDYPANIYIITIGILVVIFFVTDKFVFSKEYAKCPYCDKSILVKYDWGCDYCHNKQGEKRFLTEPCKKCKRTLKTVVCEHCDKEMGL